jgi:hypothetical protein
MLLYVIVLASGVEGIVLDKRSIFGSSAKTDKLLTQAVRVSAARRNLVAIAFFRDAQCNWP